MKIQIALLLASLCLFQTSIYGQQKEQPLAKVTIQVVDEKNTPVLDAHVRIGFLDKHTLQQAMLTGETDGSGKFTGEGASDIKLDADTRKDGYYISGTGTVFKAITNGFWLPWNPTLVTIMRPIGKPVALYARTVHLQIPALDEPCGFDLAASDWVAPYGKGMNKDFIFTIHEKWNGNYDFDVQGELTFKNPLDGLQEVSIPDIAKNSMFKWERLAPENGYNPKQELRDAWFPDGKMPIRSYKKETAWDGYFFRVRTVEQDGKIVSAHYGKIRGGIEVYPDSKTGKPQIVFTYYFNPTPNDRNLEWDTAKNLFGNLPFDQSPHEP